MMNQHFVLIKCQISYLNCPLVEVNSSDNIGQQSGLSSPFELKAHSRRWDFISER